MRSDYLIVLDLDGTLLTRSKKIPLISKLYLRHLKNIGYKIVLASGRPARSVRKFHRDLRLNTPIISLNGLHIHYFNHPEDDRRKYCDKEMIKTISNDVAKIFEINNIICETDKSIYITNKDGWLDKDFWLVNMKVKYGTLEDNLKNKVMTHIIELKDKNFNEEDVKKIFTKYEHYLPRCWTGKFRGFIEVYDDINNKYEAIKDIAKELNVKLENVYAFGDDLNDIDMLKNLPNAYAMANSLDSVKKVAHNVTKYDNEHQGVIRELRSILKNLE